MRRMLAGTACAIAVMSGAGVAAAQETEPVCDSYSGVCVLPTRAARGKPNTVPPAVRPNRQTRPDALPVTGAELLSLIALGGGAVAVGTVLATRRGRRTD